MSEIVMPISVEEFNERIGNIRRHIEQQAARIAELEAQLRDARAEALEEAAAYMETQFYPVGRHHSDRFATAIQQAEGDGRIAMGKFTIEKWKCDRCGTVMDKRPYGGGRTHYEVRISADYETAGGPVIDWREMCSRCNMEVEDGIAALKDSATEARAALEARKLADRGSEE